VYINGARVGSLSGGDELQPLTIVFDGPGATPKAAQEILRRMAFSQSLSSDVGLRLSGFSVEVAARIIDGQGNTSNAIAQEILVKPSLSLSAGASSPLGDPLGPEAKCTAANWTFRRYENGTVYSHPTQGAFSSLQSLADWNSLSRQPGKTGLLKHDAKDMPTDDGGSIPGRYASSTRGTIFFRPDVGVIEVASTNRLSLPASATSLFSSNYTLLRQRYLDYFWYNGLSAKEIKVLSADGALSPSTIRSVEITDQGVHMGEAMLAFAGEAKLLRSNGKASASSEAVIRGLLDAFDRLDSADKTLFGSDVRGFFVRDDAKQENVPWNLKSDFTDKKSSNAAMSIDQTTSLMVGWWAIAKYSSDTQSVARAKSQMRRVVDFLDRSNWVIQMPDGKAIDASRGPDFRFAAGFYCTLADNVLGTKFYIKSGVDVTLKGKPLRFRDDNLGEFTIPGYTFPAKLPVILSHAGVLGVSPVVAIGLSAPMSVPIRLGDLFKDLPKSSINLPCAHLVPAHPEGHSNTVPCTHLTVAHSSGDTIPCVHPAAVHPGGDVVHLPCVHIGKLHDHDTVKTLFGKKSVPCVHFGPVHSGGHINTLPCIHVTVAHRDGDHIPCVHPAQVHPDGDTITLPCLHLEQAHPGGHGFDPTKISVDIPLGEKVKPYARHIVLQTFAFDPKLSVVEMIPAAIQSNHVWSLLLRGQMVGDVPKEAVSALARQSLGSLKAGTAPSNLLRNEWDRSNRWELSTAIGHPDKGGPYVYNGLDYLSLEVLTRLNGIVP